VDIFEEPVMDQQGHNFEKWAIESWLLDHDTCPLGREPLTREGLFPNRALQEDILEWSSRTSEKDLQIQELLGEIERLKLAVQPIIKRPASEKKVQFLLEPGTTNEPSEAGGQPSDSAAGEKPQSGGNSALYFGTATLSLESCVLRKRTNTKLKLITGNPEHEGAVLTVTTWPLYDKEVGAEYSDLDSAVADLSGKRFAFVINVKSAAGLPATHCRRVFCTYQFKEKKDPPIQTAVCFKTTEPKWNRIKQFSWPAFTEDLAEYFCSDDVVTFEVVGQP
jgi:hypothetical protein